MACLSEKTKGGRPKGKGSKYKGRPSGKKDLGLAIQQAERKIKASKARKSKSLANTLRGWAGWSPAGAAAQGKALKQWRKQGER